MIEKLRIINNKLIQLNRDNIINLKKYYLIHELLKDDDCFKKISIEYAYSVLKDLEVKDKDLENIYCELI